MRKHSCRRGQNMIEYILFMTAVIVVLIAGILKGSFYNTTERIMNAAPTMVNAHTGMGFINVP